MEPQALAELISGTRFRFSNEAELQDAIEKVLRSQSVTYVREHRLSVKDRIDFMAGSVGIEVKVESSASTVLRQLWRYAASPEVSALILVTSKARHMNMPGEITGKPVYVAHLLASFF